MNRKPNGTGPTLSFAEMFYLSRSCLHAAAAVTAIFVFSAAGPAAADPGVTIIAPMEEQVQRESEAVKKKKKKSVAAKSSPEASVDQKAEAADKAGSKATEVKESKPKEPPYGGIFYGEIASVDPDGSSIFVVPIDKHYSRKVFYIDKFTDYFIDGEPDELDSLHISQRVAVRFFGEQTIRVAEAVYVVSGEFNPEDYQSAKKKKRAEKKVKEKKEKKKGKPKNQNDESDGSEDEPADNPEE